MGKRNRECYLCSKDYQYCGTCSQDRMKPSWMSEFHDENCKNIFNICTSFNLGLMSKAEAMEALERCDLSNKANFKSYVQRDIAKIFAIPEEPKTKRSKKVIPEETVTEHEVVTIEE